MAESVAGAEQIEQPALVHDVHPAGVDDAQVRERTAALGEDHRAAQVKLDRRLGRDLRQLVGGEGVERRTLRKEAGDLGQAGVQLALPSLVTELI
jgi:hypothetical protein